MQSRLPRFTALSSPDFRALWLAQLISIMGSQMQVVAIGWHIYLLTHSAVSLGLIGIVGTLPLIAFSFIAGVYADKHDRKHILFAAQSASGLLALVLGIATIGNWVSPLLIYTITALASICTAFTLPAQQALLPKLVKREDLTNALSLMYIMRQTSTVVGPAVAGFLIAYHGVGTVYILNSISYVAVLFALIVIKASGKTEGYVPMSSFHSAKEGLFFIKGKTIIWSTMLLDFFSTFFSSATSLLPIFAKDILMVGPQGLGLLYAAPAVGAIIAGLLVPYIEHIKKQGKIILLSVILYAVGTILFGLSKSFILSLFALAIVGAGDSVSTIIRNVIRQVETPDAIRGRMTSINMIFFMGGPQLGEFEAGLLAAIVGGPISVVIGGVATIVCVGLMTVLIPKLREYQLKA